MRMERTIHSMPISAEPVAGPLAGLTPRERQVLERTARGSTNAHTASDLEITTHAVKFHLASIYRKLRVANRTEATALYVSALAREDAGSRL